MELNIKNINNLIFNLGIQEKENKNINDLLKIKYFICKSLILAIIYFPKDYNTIIFLGFMEYDIKIFEYLNIKNEQITWKDSTKSIELKWNNHDTLIEKIIDYLNINSMV